MLTGIIFGEKYTGWPTKDGIRKELYCTKCEQNRPFLEMSGRKFFHIYYIPLIPLSKKIKWLECYYCDSVLLDFEEKLKDYEKKIKEQKEFENLKKEMTSYIEELDYINVKCPSCKKDGKVKFAEDQSSAEAICRYCGNIYMVKKDN